MLRSLLRGALFDFVSTNTDWAPELLLSRIPGPVISALQIQSTMPHPITKVREPSGGNRHNSRSEPGLPNYCYHESMRPCPPCPGHVPRGHGVRGRSGLEDSPRQPSRAKTGNARGAPASEAFWLNSSRRTGWRRHAFAQVGSRAPG